MTSREVSIRTNEPAEGGVIVPALQIVQASLPIVDVATITQGIVQSQGVEHTGGGGGSVDELAPAVVVVGDNLVTVGVQQGHDVALEIQGVEVGVAIVGHGHRVALGIVSKAHDQAVVLHVGQQAGLVVVIVGICAVGSAGSHAVGIIGHVPGGGTVGHGLELPTPFPGVDPGAVVQRSAYWGERVGSQPSPG